MTIASTTWNPADKGDITLSGGNLIANSGTSNQRVRSVFGATSGKYYWEISFGRSVGGYDAMGVCGSEVALSGSSNTDFPVDVSTAAIWANNGNIYPGDVSCSGEWYSAAVLMFALDRDAGKIWFGKDGAWQGSGDPAAGTNPARSGLTGTVYAMMSMGDFWHPSDTYIANFGASAFAYTPPSGFEAGFGIEASPYSNSTASALSISDAAEGFFGGGDATIADSLSIFDSATVGMESRPSLSESLTITDSASASIETGEAAVSESLAISDSAEAFNWTQWLALNFDRAVQRFYLTLTGAANLLADIGIPMSSFQIRSSDLTRYLSAEIPTLAYAADINLRVDGTLRIDRAYVLDGSISVRDTIAEAPMDGIRVYEGGNSQSVSLEGHVAIALSSNTVTLRQVESRQITNGAMSSVRCCGLDFLIRPGDTIVDGAYSMVASTVIHTVSASQSGVDAYVDITG